LAQALYQALVPLTQLLCPHGIGEAEHGNFVAHLFEISAGRRSHFLSGTIKCNQFGILGFQSNQLIEKLVEFGVGNFRAVENVITKSMMIDLALQLVHSHRHIDLTRHNQSPRRLIQSSPSRERMTQSPWAVPEQIAAAPSLALRRFISLARVSRMRA